MPVVTLPLPEHGRIALELLDEADLELAVGKPMKASEMLWGAVAHALIALALQMGRPYNSHGALRNVARQLPNVPNRTHWLTEFDVAEDCHSNFYHGHLTDVEVMQCRPRINRLVDGLLDMANQFPLQN